MKNLIPILIISLCLWSCSSDNESSNLIAPPLNFTEVMSFETDTLDIDIISDIAENSLYITHSSIIEDSEDILKYDLLTLTQNVITHTDLSESRQIEISGGYLFSFGIDAVHKTDLDLENFVTVNSEYFSFFYPRAIKYGDDIILPFGMDNLISFNTLTNDSNGAINTDSNLRFRSDGEVFNDKLYTFGGSSLFGSPIYNEINIYDFMTDTWSIETLPYGIYESFTSLYNDSVIVAGNKESDNSNAFISLYDIPTNTFSELTTSLDLNNITIRGITILNDEVFIAYTDLISPMPSLITIKIVKASLI